MTKRKQKRCSCGNRLEKGQDICSECAQADDCDREMLGEDYDYFEASGYFEEHGH